MTSSLCSECIQNYMPVTEFTFSDTITFGNSLEIVADAAALGRQYWILSCRVVSASGTTTSVTFNGSDICPVSPVTFEGTIENVLLDGFGLSFDVSVAGSATITGTGKWA